MPKRTVITAEEAKEAASSAAPTNPSPPAADEGRDESVSAEAARTESDGDDDDDALNVLDIPSLPPPMQATADAKDNENDAKGVAEEEKGDSAPIATAKRRVDRPKKTKEKKAATTGTKRKRSGRSGRQKRKVDYAEERDEKDGGNKSKKKKKAPRQPGSKFYARIEELKRFREEHGRFPLTYRDGTLYDFCRGQRRLRTRWGEEVRPDDERVTMLDSIDFPWDLKVLKGSKDYSPVKVGKRGRKGMAEMSEEEWADKFNELVQFKEEHGHSNVPTTNKSIGRWCKIQRQLREESSLADDRLQRLESVGFDWHVKFSARKEEEWQNMYEALCRYRERTGDCAVPHPSKLSDPDDIKLSRWVQKNRSYIQSKQKGNTTGKSISAERVKMLLDIGFIANPGKESLTQRAWDKMIDTLENFKTEYGHCNVPMRLKSHGGLSRWVRSIRQKYADKELPQERIEQLTQMGFEFSVSPHKKRRTWDDRYEQLCQFWLENGHCDVPCKYQKVLLLPKWVKQQRLELKAKLEGKKSELTWDRYVKLHQLGFDFLPDADEREKCATKWTFCTCDFGSLDGDEPTNAAAGESSK